MEELFCRCFFFFFRLSGLTARAQFLLLAGGAARIALCARDDVDDDLAVVLATFRTCAVSDAKRATVAFRETLTCYCVMRAPLGGLGTIPAHSYYHMSEDYTE